MIETGVIFTRETDIHSFRDLNLVLAPFVLTPAKPKLNYIDVPGRDGSIDATEATGEVKYNDREFSFTFTVFPNDELTFEERQTVVSNALNGKIFKITIEKDPDYFLIGRCTVNEYFSNKKLRQIVVSVRAEPYKMRQNPTIVTTNLYNDEEKTIALLNGRRKALFTIKTDNPIFVSFNGYSFEMTMPSITVKNFKLCLSEGTNQLTLKRLSNQLTTVEIEYQEGDL